MAKGIPVVRIQEPSSEAPPWQGTDAEGSGGSADRLPGVRGSRTQTTQTSKGAVRPEGKPRYYSNPLLSSAVPSKAECLADQRLFLLVREGTYDEVLRELEAAPQHDAEAAWNKAKLLRLVQRHRQRTYGSIRNGVTSKRKELTPEVSASTTQNLDTQLPASERPSGDEVAKRLMHDLAVLQGLQPAPLMKEQAKPVHEQIYVPEAVYAEDDLRRSRASSAQELNRTSTPLTNELPLPQSLSREFSSISFASFASKSSSFASFASKSSSNPLAELSASSNSSERRKGGRRSAPSAPLFVNRHSWNLQHALPANDASHRDRRMNSPVGDTPSRGDWSRLSFSPLEPQKTHGVWGTDWRHPSDIFKTKPGINSSGIKIVNSKEFRRVSALIDDSHLKSLSGVSLSTSVPHRMWPAAPPKMGLVRIARESAQKEAEKFAEENRALRLEQAERDIAGVASQAKGFSETMDEAVFKTIQKAQELWERSFDAMTALDTSTVEQSRMDDMRHLVLKIENEQKKKEQELKAAIKETWKADLVATALQREEATLSSIHATMLAVQEHAASLAADRLEVARKKVEKEEAALERYEQEMSNHSERLEDEQQVSAFSAAGFAEAQAKRDALAREVNELNEEVKEYQHDFARFKTQIFLFESDAYEASRQGKPDIVKTFKEKADAVRAQLAPLGPALAAVEEKLRILNGNLAILEEGVREWENIVHKDQTRLQEMQKVCASDLVRKQELQNKLMFERQEEQELSKRFEERSAAVTATRQKAKEEQDDAESQSDNTVITRLRASSLALVAKTKLLSKDPELDVEEQEPVYIGERLDGKRHGFGILQYPAGAEYVGQFEDDLPSGMGIERYADGTVFEGCFLKGRRHGLGVYSLASAMAYLGVFQEGKRCGPGVICIQSGSASMPYWPTIVCVCRAESHQAVMAIKFCTDCAHHALLATDALLVQRTARDMAKRARSLGLTSFFAKEQDAQISSLECMGLSVTPKAPLFQAFGKSDSCLETQRVVSVKMQDAEAVARMAATPGGRKAVQRARRRSRLPFETGEGRRHATSIYSTSPAVSAYYKL